METTNIKPIKIEDEMRVSYLDYAMSVIVSRALPDVRDGLKPVHRRILFAMQEMGITHSTPYKKSARIVGEVLGKYHPHGDTAVYDAMVRLAQDFSMRYPLIDGQGNFGSVDNDPPAAMRYTEARLSEIAQEMLVDIDKDTVDFTPNFDDSLKEPSILPARLPNLLVNGAAGIAVGMATNIPPHNLNEVCDVIVQLIDNPDLSVEEVADLIRGPDFPTRGIILASDSSIKQAYCTGRGKVVIRAKAYIEEMVKGRFQIIVSELPYQTNKAALVEKIAELARNKKVGGIAEIRDESDREGMRIVMELKKEAQPRQVLNNLYKFTAMQSAFFINMVALVDRQPRLVSLKQALQRYIEFRREVVTRRSHFELAKARDRAHILEGLKVALDHLDQVIAIIRRSANADAARTSLMQTFGLSVAQAQAILDMQLRRLAALERQKILEEYTEVLKTIAYLEDLLASPRKIDLVIRQDVNELKSKYGDDRRTQISEEETSEFVLEDLIPHQQMAITISQRGYVKRMPLDVFRVQLRGGKGIRGMVTREEDIVQHLLVADVHDNLLFFTNRGKVYQLKCRELPPEMSRTAKGRPLINMVALDPEERVTAVVAVPSYEGNDFLLLATRNGEVKKTPLEHFSAVRSNGLIAMDLAKEDELVSAQFVRDQDQVILATSGGYSIRFEVSTLRPASRLSGGVRGIRLPPDDSVISLSLVRERGSLLTVTANGIGKCSSLEEYPVQGRGGSGVMTHKVTARTGELMAATVVSPSQELMLISKGGIVIRMSCQEIPRYGRASQGVSLKKLEEGDVLASIACWEGGKGEKPRPAPAPVSGDA